MLFRSVAGTGAIPASTVDTTPVAAVVGGFSTELNITIDGVNIVTTGGVGTLTADENGARYVSQINAALAAASKTGITAAYDTTTDNITISSAKNLAVTIDVTDNGDSALTPGVAAYVLAAQTNELNLEFTLDNGTTQIITTSNATGTESAIENGARYVSAINAQSATTGVSASYDTITGTITLVNPNEVPAASHNIRVTQLAGDNSGIVTTTNTTAYRYQYDPVASFKGLNLDKTFTTLADLREAMELQARDPDGNGIYTDNNIQISISASGKFEILNPGGNTNE